MIPTLPRPSAPPLPKLPARRLAAACAFALAAAAPGLAQAQSVVMAGSYQNFDVLNDNNTPACGFEMEVHGISSSQLTRIFPSNFSPNVIRYGLGSATDFPGGVYVRWMSRYDAAAGKFTSCTPVPVDRSTVPGDSCWTGGMPTTYASAGCEHFGISSNANPSKILYRWLLPDPNQPGMLVRAGTDLPIPAPMWTAVPPANPGLPPVVIAEVAMPPPPAVYGDGQWVRVLKTEIRRKVDLDELMGDNAAIVPRNAAQVESSWDFMQPEPPGGQRRRGRVAHQGNSGNGNHAVVRRYEFYKYSGAYDPVTHEALCADLTCTAPGPGELGDAIGAQNAAANLDLNALTVAVVGSGRVQSGDKTYDCPSKCYGVYNPGATVTLTAKASSGNSFATCGGACGGNAPTCTVPVNAESSVTATFVAAGGGGAGGGGGGAASTYRLTVSLGNPGTVTSTPSGIQCGAVCAASFTAGSAVTLTATPLPGLAFTGWSGACGTTLSPVCTLTMGKDQTTKANFTK